MLRGGADQGVAELLSLTSGIGREASRVRNKVSRITSKAISRCPCRIAEVYQDFNNPKKIHSEVSGP